MKEVHIAICDKSLDVCVILQKAIQALFEKEKKSYDIKYFQEGKTFCRDLMENQYDLIFLDIELSGKNGIEVGRYIRKTLCNEMTEIVYISDYTQYAMELFDIRPLNFLIKPLVEEEIRQVIYKFMYIMEQKMSLFAYKKGRKINQIPLMNIMYFEKEKRKIIITTSMGKDCFYGAMEDVYEQLKERRFLFIHKSVIVNFNYVRYIEYEQVCMSNKKIFSISQSKRKDIYKQALKFYK